MNLRALVIAPGTVIIPLRGRDMVMQGGDMMNSRMATFSTTGFQWRVGGLRVVGLFLMGWVVSCSSTCFRCCGFWLAVVVVVVVVTDQRRSRRRIIHLLPQGRSCGSIRSGGGVGARSHHHPCPLWSFFVGGKDMHGSKFLRRG